MSTLISVISLLMYTLIRIKTDLGRCCCVETILLTGMRLMGEGVAGTTSSTTSSSSSSSFEVATLLVVGTTKLKGENCPFVAASTVVMGAAVVVTGARVVVDLLRGQYLYGVCILRQGRR